MNQNSNALQIHNKLMDSIISIYRTKEKHKPFDPANITKDGLKNVGLEKIAKDLYQLSNKRLTNLAKIQAP